MKYSDVIAGDSRNPDFSAIDLGICIARDGVTYEAALLAPPTV